MGALTNHLWQSTWFAIAMGLLTLAFRRNRAAVRYWLWFAASVKFFLPFSLLMSLGSLLPAPTATPIAPPAVSFAIEQIGQPFAVALPAMPAAHDHVDWLPIAIVSVWACGFAAIVAVRFRAWLRILTAVGASQPLEFPAAVEVRSTPGLLEPGVVGWWRPILLLPAGIADRLTARQLEAVIAHELCHVRRRDNLLSAVQMLVEAVFWFHPLIWWIGARLVEERERACDEAVLSLGSQPREYVEAILGVCKFYLESPLACVSGVTGADLKKRVHTILSGATARDLSFSRKALLGAAALALLSVPVVARFVLAPSLRAQPMKFEVASVKPCKAGEFAPDMGGGGKQKGGRSGAVTRWSPGRLDTGCTTVAELIKSAYISYATGTLHRDPSVAPPAGGPAWIEAERYTISAKADNGASQGAMEGAMMRTLLEERFHLKTHHESRAMPVYALTVAKGGPKLKPFQEGTCVTGDVWTPRRDPLPDGQHYCRAMFRNHGPNIRFEGEGVSLDQFARLISLGLGRPGVDQTGLAGLYAITLEFVIDDDTPGFKNGPAPPPDPAAAAIEPGASIFAAVQQQLGLKLEPSKAPRDILVIDHVERPTAN